MEDSVFTKIIHGDIPCHKVLEDDKTIAFMDINPLATGMVLVVPKVQVDNIEDLADEDYQALWASAKLVMHKLRAVFPGVRKIGVQVEGLDVPHVHVKLFPFNTSEEFRARANSDAEPDHAALAELSQKLAAA